MLTEHTCIGLEVHARPVVAAANDVAAGEVFKPRVTQSHDHTCSSVTSLSDRVAVAYEAGPTGFGCFRALTE